MSLADASTTPPEPTRAAPTAPERRRRRPGLLLSIVIVVVAFAVAGVVAGWLWHQLWTPPQGELVHVPVDGGGTQLGWYPIRGDAQSFSADETAIGQQFGSTGLFILVGLVGGLVLGVVSGLVARRAEVLMLVVVGAAGVLAAYLTYRVGLQLSPPDPLTLQVPDFTRVPASMNVSGHSPFAFWSLGAVLGAGGVFFLTTPGAPRPAPRIGPEPDGVETRPSQ